MLQFQTVAEAQARTRGRTHIHVGPRPCLHQLRLVCRADIDLQASYELALKPPLLFYRNMINIINLFEQPSKGGRWFIALLINWDSMVQCTTCNGAYATLAYRVVSSCC